MFQNPSLITRIAIGKGIGFIVGVTAFFFLPYFMPNGSLLLQWGVFLWYITFGAIIGVFGVMTRIPYLNLPMPWWFRGPYIGAWLNFILSLIAYDLLAEMLVAVFGEGGLFNSPFWLALEGIIVAFVIDFFATKYGGEGHALVNEMT